MSRFQSLWTALLLVLAAAPPAAAQKTTCSAENKPSEAIIAETVMGVVGLDHDLARILGASGAARDLYELLGHALAGPEVGAVKPLIAVHDRTEWTKDDIPFRYLHVIPFE